jgi:hypothetical protein
MKRFFVRTAHRGTELLRRAESRFLVLVQRPCREPPCRRTPRRHGNNQFKGNPKARKAGSRRRACVSAGRSLRVSDSANPTASAVPNELRVLLREAMDVLSAATHHDANALFGGRVFEPADRSPTAAHAMGVVEGAAVALGMTALELLNEMGLCTFRR